MAEPRAEAHGHEEPGFQAGKVALVVVGLFGLVAIALGGAALILTAAIDREGLPVRPPPSIVHAQPRLQLAPERDLAELTARHRRQLHKEAAVPIERAMEEVAARADPYAPIAAGPPGDER